MSDVPVWTCTFGEITGTGATGTAGASPPKLDHLTAGDRFRMSCSGDLAVDWGPDVPVIKFAKPEHEYALVILAAENLRPQSAQFTVTGYRPGDHAPEYLRVMQNDRGFEFEKPKWKIESVLSADKKPAQPYPSVGPFHVRGPAWLGLTIALLLGLTAAWLIRWVYRWSKRRKFRRELEGLRTALTPAHQFYRDARALRRRLNAAVTSAEVAAVGGDLDANFRRMLAVKFEVPATSWTDAQIIKDLRRRHRPVMELAGDPLRKVLRELTRARGRTETPAADVDQLLRMCVDATELMERGAP